MPCANSYLLRARTLCLRAWVSPLVEGGLDQQGVPADSARRCGFRLATCRLRWCPGRVVGEPLLLCALPGRKPSRARGPATHGRGGCVGSPGKGVGCFARGSTPVPRQRALALRSLLVTGKLGGCSAALSSAPPCFSKAIEPNVIERCYRVSTLLPSHPPEPRIWLLSASVRALKFL